ncbi:hypothetical protein [Sporichthya polymorpha]|uniref:hypothetical protein n=1 Tax=Sporichthya polymorpha TaxID=35751 RepID=UPI00037CE9AD|nr:hypothetical protein [Sporichthya polymorpha]
MAGRHHRAVVATTSAALLIGGLAVVAAPPASAASRVTFCFTWEGNGFDGVQRSGTPYADEPVYLVRVVNGKKTTLRSARTDRNGCGEFRTPRNVRVFVRAATEIGHTKTGGTAVDFWSGRTRSAAPGDFPAVRRATVTHRSSISAISGPRR